MLMPDLSDFENEMDESNGERKFQICSNHQNTDLEIVQTLWTGEWHLDDVQNKDDHHQNWVHHNNTSFDYKLSL